VRGPGALRSRNHRQHGAGRAAAPDVKDRPHGLHALDRPDRAGEFPQFVERPRVEQVAVAGPGEHDAVTIRRAEQGGHFVHEPKVRA